MVRIAPMDGPREASVVHVNDWTPDSWLAKASRRTAMYDEPQALEAALAKLRALPPLVSSWEIERLKGYIAEAQQGRRFWLQGGDCAETLADCRSEVIAAKLKILLQMSLILTQATKRPVIRVGRIAGQYAKPRSSSRETRPGADGRLLELPSYQGDLMNRWEFTPEARALNPHLMVEGYQHAALTLNFVRSLIQGGFADPHHPENWDLDGVAPPLLPEGLRAEYERARTEATEAMRFTAALGEAGLDAAAVELFTSHEGLNLHYESAQTRRVPRRAGYYDLTTHFPWIGERTRHLDGPHVEYFSGIQNPVGVKLGPTATADEVLRLADALNPANEPGKLVLVARLGATRVADLLPPLVSAVRREARHVLWVCDPMHGNTRVTAAGLKTRSFDDVLAEIEVTMDVHAALGSVLGGIHFELTGEDVTECTGGAAGLRDEDLERNYATRCDPRLNYSQALEMAFRVARRVRDGNHRSR